MAKRTTSYTTHDYATEPPGIIITKQTMDILLKQDQPNKLIGLYVFYLYTAFWQQNTTIKANNKYTAKGMKCSERTVQIYRKQLIRLGLIEPIRRHKHGRISGHYTKVNYARGITTPIKNVGLGEIPTNTGILVKNKYGSNGDFASGKDPRVTLTPSNGFPTSYAKHLKTAIDRQDKMRNKARLATWAREIGYLHFKDKVPKADIKRVLQWYIEHLHDQYTPALYKVTDLRAKWKRIKDARRRWFERTKDAEQEDEFVTVVEEKIGPDRIRRTFHYHEEE